MVDNPDLLLLCSAKDEEWAKFFCSHFENNDLEYINIVVETLENFCWPLPKEKENQFRKSAVILIVYSCEFIDFYRDHTENFFSLGKLFNPKSTISVLHNVSETDLKSSLTFNFSFEDCYHFQSDEVKNIAHTVEALLKQDKNTKKKQKSSFKLIPKKVYEGKGRVHIILEQPLTENQELKVFMNVSLILTEITVRKLNPYCWQFDVPDHYLRDATVLKVGIFQDETILEVQKMRCESRLTQLYNLLSGSCCAAELMIDALEVNTYSALDNMLAAAFKKRFPKAELCQLYISEHDAGYTKAKQEIPTLIHFAARYGLTKLMQELLQCPGALSACNMKNSFGRIPAELASDFKHHDIKEIVKEFQKSKDIETEIRRIGSYDTLPPAPSIPNVPSSILNDNLAVSILGDDNIYDIPPSLPVPVVEYEEIRKEANDNNDIPFMPDFSPTPTNESTFLESQAKLLEINEAYKKGASELEVMTMFDKWKSTYNVDSEAKSMLRDLRLQYAERNKAKLSKKHSISFSEFKHLFKFKFRRKSVDSQDIMDPLNDINYKYPKHRSNSKKHSERNSHTFSTTSYTSASSSSSSDRMSFVSENSDYYDCVASFMNLSDLYEKNANTRLTDSSKYSDSRQTVDHLYSISPHSKETNSIICNATENGISKIPNFMCRNLRNQSICPSICESHRKWYTSAVKSSSPNSDKCDGYDFLPARSPVPVNLPKEILRLDGCNNNSEQTKNLDVPSYITDYDVPKPPVELQEKIVLNSTNVHMEFSHGPVINRYSKNVRGKNGKCNLDSNFNHQQAYENLSPNANLPRCDSIPDEIAPLPPTFEEEEEHYKYVGTPVPVTTIT